MKKHVFLIIGAILLVASISFTSHSACINPRTGGEYVIPNPNGPGLAVLSANVGGGACMGCGGCIIPLPMP